MKTFQDCCDEVAKKHGFENFSDISAHNAHVEIPFDYYKEAAELYACEKVKEAVKLAQETISYGHFPEPKYTENEILEILALSENKKP